VRSSNPTARTIDNGPLASVSRADLPWQFEKKGKQVEVAVEGRLRVNDPELAIRAALDGVGVLYYSSGGYLCSRFLRKWNR
jgi:hypothetical protein